VIARTEVVRAVRRFGEDAVQLARELLRDVASIDLNNQLADTAADLDPTVLRSLDALHLAAAVRVAPSLKAMLSYDKRMIEAARAAGLTVHHPGA
jgi:predicted nucleic acid-binding protein